MADKIIVLGVIAGIIFYELTEISPGGVIVPGYIALFLDNPVRIVLTVCVSAGAFVLVRILSKHAILYGKRKFAVFILAGFMLRHMLGAFISVTEIPLSAGLVIGYLVPGIIAQEMDRQGLVKTLASMLIVALMVKLMVMLPGVSL